MRACMRTRVAELAERESLVEAVAERGNPSWINTNKLFCSIPDVMECLWQGASQQLINTNQPLNQAGGQPLSVELAADTILHFMDCPELISACFQRPWLMHTVILAYACCAPSAYSLCPQHVLAVLLTCTVSLEYALFQAPSPQRAFKPAPTLPLTCTPPVGSQLPSSTDSSSAWAAAET